MDSMKPPDPCSRRRRLSRFPSPCIAPLRRGQRVDMAAAKKEGKVVWYTSTPIETAQKIANLFEAETGIKVELFRSGGSAILRRFQQESQAGRDRRRPADDLRSGGRRARWPGRACSCRSSRRISTRCPDARQGPGRLLRRAAAQPDDDLRARSDKLPRADAAEDLGRPDRLRNTRASMVMTDPSFTSLQLIGRRHAGEAARLGLSTRSCARTTS